MVEIGKSEHHHWILPIRISLGSKFQFKLAISIFGLNLPQKGISGLKQENCSFAYAHRPYLLQYTFPHIGRMTQRYVSYPTSRRDNSSIM